eukprot:TRINITY_DN8309_c0_g1_i5.p1 TRINITY_DN8309_c0_g1~~TRINITY_DN8309_c0_g1_i5.p1  ORF type:complete len:299 (-),score=26.35 TRINITY_DN8309_c0_g1_i5:34-930(-)
MAEGLADVKTPIEYHKNISNVILFPFFAFMLAYIFWFRFMKIKRQENSGLIALLGHYRWLSINILMVLLARIGAMILNLAIVETKFSYQLRAWDRIMGVLPSFFSLTAYLSLAHFLHSMHLLTLIERSNVEKKQEKANTLHFWSNIIIFSFFAFIVGLYEFSYMAADGSTKSLLRTNFILSRSITGLMFIFTSAFLLILLSKFVRIMRQTARLQGMEVDLQLFMRGGLYLAKAGLEYIGEGFDKSIYLVGVQSEKDTSLVFIAYLVIYYLLFELAPLAIVLVIPVSYTHLTLPTIYSV